MSVLLTATECVALGIAGYSGGDSVRAWLHRDRKAKAAADGIVALGAAVYAAASWAGRSWVQFWFGALLAGFFAWCWWRGGGGDDWRKRRRRLAAWARSHLPRPTITPTRAAAGGLA